MNQQDPPTSTGKPKSKYRAPIKLVQPAARRFLELDHDDGRFEKDRAPPVRYDSWLSPGPPIFAVYPRESPRSRPTPPRSVHPTAGPGKNSFAATAPRFFFAAQRLAVVLMLFVRSRRSPLDGPRAIRIAQKKTRNPRPNREAGCRKRFRLQLSLTGLFKVLRSPAKAPRQHPSPARQDSRPGGVQQIDSGPRHAGPEGPGHGPYGNHGRSLIGPPWASYPRRPRSRSSIKAVATRTRAARNPIIPDTTRPSLYMTTKNLNDEGPVRRSREKAVLHHCWLDHATVAGCLVPSIPGYGEVHESPSLASSTGQGRLPGKPKKKMPGAISSDLQRPPCPSRDQQARGP